MSYRRHAPLLPTRCRSVLHAGALLVVALGLLTTPLHLALEPHGESGHLGGGPGLRAATSAAHAYAAPVEEAHNAADHACILAARGKRSLPPPATCAAALRPGAPSSTPSGPARATGGDARPRGPLLHLPDSPRPPPVR